MPHRDGFTLIEILVVLVILALLAALLLPVFSRARGKARQTKCLSNLRQLGAGLRMYLDDHDGLYPYDVGPRRPAKTGATPADDGTNKWDASPVVGLLQPYLGGAAEVGFCPDQRRDLPDIGPRTNYEFNGFLALNDSPAAPHAGPVHDGDLPDPSSVLAFEDYSDRPTYHAGYRNFAMCDGSAQCYPVAQQGAAPCHAKWWY